MFRQIVLVLGVSAVSFAGSLVLVEGDASGYPAGWESFLEPYYFTSEYTIGSAVTENIPQDMKFSVLELNMGDLREYRIVFLSEESGVESASGMGSVLFKRELIMLVRTHGALIDPGVLPGVHFSAPLAPQNPSYEPVDLDFSRGYDDHVADIVAAVSEDSVKAFTQNLQDFVTRHSSTDNFDNACIWVEEKFESYGLPAQQQHFSTLGYDCQNVIAHIAGSEDSTKIYLITGHLDSTSPVPYSNAPGADDNASGSSAVLEAARIFSQYEFKYTVRFVCFGGEEQGLYGSRYYAQQASAAGDDIIGVVNLDMIYYAPSGGEVLWVPYDTQSTGLALAMEAICDTFVPALTVDVEYSPGSTYSDHASFWQEGYAAVLGIEQEVWTNPYYHQTTDLLQNYLIYFPFGTNCVKAGLATVSYLAEPIGFQGTEDADQYAGFSDLFSVDAFPNPSLSSVVLTFNRELTFSFNVMVYDISGRVLVNRTVNPGEPAGSYTLNTESLPQGIFHVRVSSEGFQATARLVKTE